MKKLLIVFFCIVISFAALNIVNCQKTEQKIPVLRLGHAPNDHHSPLFIAAMNPEYFKKHGGIYLKEISFREEYDLISNDQHIARVLINSSTGGQELIRKLSEGHFDMALGGVPAILNFIDQGKPMRILAPVMTEGAGFVLHKDLPANNWSEFISYVKTRKQPLKIGYKIALAVQKLIFESALREEGITYSSELGDSAQITLVNLYGPKNLIPALENNLIDGFVVNQPTVALAEEKGIGKNIALLSDLPPENKWRGNPCCALAGNKSYIETQNSVTGDMITLILRANQFIGKYPQKSSQQIARWLNTPPKAEELSIPTIKFTTNFDESWNRGVDFWVETMIEAGKFQGKVKDAYQTGTLEQLIYNKELYTNAKERLK